MHKKQDIPKTITTKGGGHRTLREEEESPQIVKIDKEKNNERKDNEKKVCARNGRGRIIKAYSERKGKIETRR